MLPRRKKQARFAKRCEAAQAHELNTVVEKGITDSGLKNMHGADAIEIAE